MTRKNITLDDLRDRLGRAGIGASEDTDAFAALFTGMHILASELGYCLSISSTKEKIETLEDFDITFKNLETDKKYDLKRMMALIAGVEIKDEEDK
ncbi:MAG: hypothetical protein ACRCYT_09505 [Cetobacterium sp.]